MRLEPRAAGEVEDVRVVLALRRRDRHSRDVDDMLGVIGVAPGGEAAVDVEAVVMRSRSGGRSASGEEAAAAPVDGERIPFRAERAGSVVQLRIEIHPVDGDPDDTVPADEAIGTDHHAVRLQVETELPEPGDPLSRADVTAEEGRPAVVVVLLFSATSTRLIEKD